ncbi:hypothetical protein TIFTF001_020909 [Ficus carica]|uniref:WAT1-related protein n=1 Tax=Ficus carica TaxID=3494 RepID=A0AA88DA93_FICCA|nr:hypothetical protein TIFTF001_020909 [Ficus carica]
MIITFALGAIVLAETVHLGSIVGAIFIVFGLYTVVWGKSKDPIASAAPLKDDKTQELPITDTNAPPKQIAIVTTINTNNASSEMSKISPSQLGS